MNPTNSSLNKDTCASTSSNCVIWEGPDLECISLCTGDTVSDAVSKMAIAFCEFKDLFDFSDLDLKCIFEACEACPEPDKSLTNILKLLISKVCALEDLINECCEGGNEIAEPGPWDVNMKCLAAVDGGGNTTNDDTQEEIIQSMIDQICENKDDIALLVSQVEDHEVRITALENAIDDPIPDVTSDCVFIGSKPIDEAYELLDADYCAEKTAIGDPTEIGTAIGRQCELPALVGNPAFIVSPSNLAESANNMWLALCDILTRLTFIEDNCCQPTCDDIKVGFSTVFNADDTVTLEFNAGTGTSIPAGWTDCGSILTVSDTFGNSITVLLTITNNYTSPAIDLTSFTKGTLLTFSLDLKMCNDSITCQKCITKTVQYSNTECCTITNNGAADITIVYSVPLTEAL